MEKARFQSPEEEGSMRMEQRQANHDVDKLAVLVYVDQYNEETGDWEQVYSWAKEAENTYYVSTGKTLQVPRGYYYRVHCDALCGKCGRYSI